RTTGNTAPATNRDIPTLAVCGMEEEDRRGASSTIAMMRKKTRRNRRMWVTGPVSYVRNHREEPLGIPYQGVKQEPSQEDQPDQNGGDLRHESQGLLLYGGSGLQDGNDETHGHCDQQERPGQNESLQDPFADDLEGGTGAHLKLLISCSVRRPHPFTSTNRISLNGVEIITGGSMIIPIDISVEATTMSMMMNGIKRRIPILNATVISWITKAGIST